MVRIKLYDVLKLTQQHISKYYATALTDESKHEDLKSYIEKYLPKMDNWATCDLFVSTLKFVNKYQDISFHMY